ncbi:hypothetical protein HPP92_025520 [Vanilla planifolia]|uniref:GPI inositol-deacylase n=1 Tax=Vanilla planifolia TaxID=51239 RepID=A0A835PFI8_VANPL|nr:hypothetical protein HPP92_025520 [Vanilla planifolia]
MTSLPTPPSSNLIASKILFPRLLTPQLPLALSSFSQCNPQSFSPSLSLIAKQSFMYLERVKEAVSEAKELCLQGGSIALIGHSAGGWLARVYMEEFGKSDISLLLTLGTPHLYIRGARMVGKAPAENEGIPESTEKEDNGGSQPAHVAPTLRTRFIGQGYKQAKWGSSNSGMWQRRVRFREVQRLHWLPRACLHLLRLSFR